jgi:type II secretory pathway pseudopilin PulG
MGSVAAPAWGGVTDEIRRLSANTAAATAIAAAASSARRDLMLPLPPMSNRPKSRNGIRNLTSSSFMHSYQVILGQM